jgi:hypothetical protein
MQCILATHTARPPFHTASKLQCQPSTLLQHLTQIRIVSAPHCHSLPYLTSAAPHNKACHCLAAPHCRSLQHLTATATHCRNTSQHLTPHRRAPLQQHLTDAAPHTSLHLTVARLCTSLPLPPPQAVPPITPQYRHIAPGCLCVACMWLCVPRRTVYNAGQ